MHPERLKSIVATVGIEHMGGRQTIEVGPGGNQYVYSGERPENGGVITSFNAHAVFVRYGADKHSKATGRADLEWA
jgi:hypothetical protein